MLAPNSTFFLILEVSILCAIIIGRSGVFSMRVLDVRIRQKSIMIIILYFKDSEQKDCCHIVGLGGPKHSWCFVCAVTEMKYQSSKNYFPTLIF